MKRRADSPGPEPKRRKEETRKRVAPPAGGHAKKRRAASHQADVNVHADAPAAGPAAEETAAEEHLEHLDLLFTSPRKRSWSAIMRTFLSVLCI